VEYLPNHKDVSSWFCPWADQAAPAFIKHLTQWQ
jgi:hypothetical protein